MALRKFLKGLLLVILLLTVLSLCQQRHRKSRSSSYGTQSRGSSLKGGSDYDPYSGSKFASRRGSTRRYVSHKDPNSQIKFTSLSKMLGMENRKKPIDGRYGMSIGDDKTTCKVGKNGKKKCTRGEKEALSSSFIFMLVIVGAATVFIIPLICSDFFWKHSHQHRFKTLMQQEIDGHTKGLLSSTIYPLQRQKLLNRFIFVQDKMIIRYREVSKKLFCKLRLADCKKISTYQYHFVLEGEDKLGTSESEGYIIFSGDEMKIVFSKHYKNKTQSGERDEYCGLKFEGNCYENCMKGKWSVIGDNNAGKESGEWDVYYT